jgi:hypothetical protein
MKPGRELDKAVARVMGRVVLAVEGDYVLATSPGKPYDKLPKYSTKIAAAWRAWEWLEKNHPWVDHRDLSTNSADICLGYNETIESPCIFVMRTHWDGGMPGNTEPMWDYDNFAIPGESYPHAICLAVLETVEAR